MTQLMRVHAEMVWHNRAVIVLLMVPRSASHAIPGGLSTPTEPSAYVRERALRSIYLHESLLVCDCAHMFIVILSEAVHVQERRGRNWIKLPN